MDLIVLTRPCNEHPGRPHYILEKWGLPWYTIYFSTLLRNIDCWLLVSEYPQSKFGANVRKISSVNHLINARFKSIKDYINSYR